MKRWMVAFATVALAGYALAQAPFTIVRPAEGAKVREVVRVLVPKNSVPEGGYVGVYMDGKFLEATALALKGDYYEYRLDTKASKITDGKHRIELVLYAEAGDKARILDRSSVEIDVQNVASIPIPDEGLKLRYKFVRGSELVYNIDLNATLMLISEHQARNGGRAAELPYDSDKFRMLYAIDNSYPDGDGLVRMQAMPLPGKNYIFFKLVESAGGDLIEGRRYGLNEMHPLYMRLTNTGKEKFGAVPLYVPMEGSGTLPDRSDLYVVFPFPTLPEKQVKPGDVWQGRFLIPTLDLDNLYDTKKITENLPARGEFVGVEWERGHPCAKIKVSFAQQLVPAKVGADGKVGMGGDRMSVEQTTWLALDRGVPLKIMVDVTRDTRSTAMGAEGAGGMFDPRTGRRRSRGDGGDTSPLTSGAGIQQIKGGRGGGGQFGPPGAGAGQLGPGKGGGAMSPGAGNMQGGKSARTGPPQTQYVRLFYRAILTLQ